jgi:hypothetical protein
MNTTTTTTDNEILSLASVTCEELDGSYEAWLDEQRAKDLADYDEQLSQQQEELICDPHGDDMSEFADDQQDDGDDDDDRHGFNREPREDNFRDDVDADANALAGAGYGTDEDYGCFGGDEW